MSADHLEEMELRFEEGIARMHLSLLFKVAEGLEMDLGDAERKTQVLRKLREWVDAKAGEDEASRISFMEGRVMVVLDKVLGDDRRRARDLDQSPSMLGGSQQDGRSFGYNEGSGGDDNREPPKSDGERAFLGMLDKLADATVSQRNVLKLTGTIGGPKDPKNITYSNLVSQITDAQADGRKDSEIVRAIKRATAANSDIRSYLDTAEGVMELTEVIEVLQNYFREKSAGDLFTELSQVTQGTAEKSTDFLLRAMQLRQRLTKTARAEKKKYDSEFVQETFMSAVKAGLAEESISAKITHLLHKVKTPDAVLLREINIAEQEHEERSKRHQKKKVTVAQASAEPASELNSLLKPLMESMASLQQQVKEMQEQKATPVQIGSAPDHWRNNNRNNNFSDRQQGATPRQGYNRETRNYGCRRCRSNNEPNCNHCFKCGLPGHQMRSCTFQSPKN